MSDDKTKRDAPDRGRIDLHDENEVRSWTQSLGVSREELERAVQAAGNAAVNVREFIGRNRAH